MSATPAGHELRPVETPPSFDDFSNEPLEALKRVDAFRALTEAEMEKVAGIAEVLKIPQDRIVPRAGEEGEASFYFVARGQVAFAEFPKGKVPKNPKDAKEARRVKPTMQQTKRVVSLFDVGDFFTNDHVEYARSGDGEKVDMGLFTCINVVAIKLKKSLLDGILGDLPAVKEAIEVKGEEAYYRQTLLKLDDRSDIFDFYIREGFKYAQAIKIIQTDKCIDCDECVKACEDRHGISRIERFGPRIGLIQFTLNCRTCADARCIEVCNFDAIAYDEGEVIVYDNCVGCIKCAKACPTRPSAWSTSRMRPLLRTWCS